MNIAYFINVYPRPSQTFIWREIAALEAQGIVVHRFALRPDAELKDAGERELTRYVLAGGPLRLVTAAIASLLARPAAAVAALELAWRCGRKSDRGVLRHFAYWAEACVLRQWLRECGAEHVHGHFGTNSAAILMLCRVLGGPRYSFTAHGPEEFDNPTGLSLGEKIRRAEFVVAVCEFGRSQLFRWCSYDQWQKIHVVRCGVDAHFLAAPAVTVPNSSKLLSVGRLAEQKGQLLLIEAAMLLKSRNIEFQLVLVGDGELRGPIESLIATYSLGSQVTLAGWKSNRAIGDLMQGSRALIMPSFAEGLPVVLMESLGLKRPVVSTYIAGIPELIENGVSGFLVPAGDVAALADAMAKILAADQQTMEKMGAAGSERVRQRHDASVEAGKLAVLFRRAVAESRSNFTINRDQTEKVAMSAASTSASN
jgi:colanic acid/amylovoran biosynthesis glycosyltransferase